ncbi:uncharacterized protein LOC142920181 [Petromyzon marinus]|uniref:uncharacterized protein LOC142920181 n=1 Tax=Petromyzon marinus TaxID=7757 RepID=UPI003F6EC429
MTLAQIKNRVPLPSTTAPIRLLNPVRPFPLLLLPSATAAALCCCCPLLLLLLPSAAAALCCCPLLLLPSVAAALCCCCPLLLLPSAADTAAALCYCCPLLLPSAAAANAALCCCYCCCYCCCCRLLLLLLPSVAAATVAALCCCPLYCCPLLLLLPSASAALCYCCCPLCCCCRRCPRVALSFACEPKGDAKRRFYGEEQQQQEHSALDWQVIQVNSSVFRPKPGSASDKIDRVTLCGQRGALQNTSMMRVRDTKIFLVSAYHDQREAGQSTRIIGIANRYEPDVLSCHFCCRGHLEILTVTASAYVHSDHFDFPYGTADFLCTEPLDCEPGHVSVQRMRTIPDEEEAEWVFMPVRNRLYMPPTFTQEFSVCISTLFWNYGNVLQFVQAIEMYRILGAGRVTVYNTSCSSELNKVLLYYIKTSLVEVVQWPITDYVRVSRGWHYPEHPGELHYYGQIAALNDCVYRHMYSTRYLVLTDIDEVIIPLKHTNLKDLMRYLNDKYGADIYTFENHVFPYNGIGRVWVEVPGVERHPGRQHHAPH